MVLVKGQFAWPSQRLAGQLPIAFVVASTPGILRGALDVIPSAPHTFS